MLQADVHVVISDGGTCLFASSGHVDEGWGNPSMMTGAVDTSCCLIAVCPLRGPVFATSALTPWARRAVKMSI